MLKTISVKNEYFSVVDTLECGQIFRYFRLENGDYLVLSANKSAILSEKDGLVYITFNKNDQEYFNNYFDFSTDYSQIYSRAISSKYPILISSAKAGKGIRILKQNTEEMLYSFLISQNNNIPRIKKSINYICEKLGEKQEICGNFYYTFPTTSQILTKNEQFYKEAGLGYRAEYILILANQIKNGLLQEISGLSQEQIKSRLLKIKGIGEKVADCVLLFGLNKTASFPVDTWIEKIYKEDFNGNLTNRNKITEFFINEFGVDSGYFQQYLFYFKRSIHKKV